MTDTPPPTSPNRTPVVVACLLIVLVAIVGWMQWRAPTSTASDTASSHASVADLPSDATIPGSSGLLRSPEAVSGDVPSRRSVLQPVIKTTPAVIADYDGTTGTITIDGVALQALNPGDFVVTRLGEHTIVHRVKEKLAREDHVYLPLDVVDPMTGEPTGFRGAYHAYDGFTNYYFNSAEGGFEVHAENGRPTKFRTFARPASVTPDGPDDGHAH